MTIHSKYGKFFLLAFLALLFVLGFVWFIAKRIQEPIKVDDAFRKNASGKFLEMKDGKTHYLISGPDTGKSIVFVHGGSQVGLYVWSANYPSLNNAGYRTCLYDLYGRGYSDRPNKDHTLELFSRQLTTFIDTFCSKQKITLIALSMGAMPAIDFASKHAEKVERIILIDPAALNAPFDNLVISTPIVNRLFITFYWHPKAVDKQMNEFYAPKLLPEYRKQLEYFSKVAGLEETNLSTWQHILSGNVRKQLQEIGAMNIPVSLIYGKNDPYFSENLAMEYLKLIPSISIYPIESAGHISNVEKPVEVNKIILEEISK